jgi:hypothetical protein
MVPIHVQGLPPIFGVTANGLRGRVNGAYAPSVR